MLEVSRKKLKIANTIYYAGIVVLLVYIVFSLMYGWPRPLALVFLVPIYIGGSMRLDLFRCPSCGKRLFMGATRKDIRKLNVPNVCPECDEPVTVVYVD